MGKVNPANFNADDLRTTQWVGIVEDTVDDIFEGRCKIRVYGKMDDRVDPEDPESAYKIPTLALPWARPHQLMYGGSNTGSGKFEIPKLGSIVRLTFDNGNFYQPIYHENIYPSDETKAEIEASYQNSHVLIYDTAFGLTGGENGTEVTNDREGEHVKVFFTEEKGVMIDYTTTTGPTSINIKPDNSVEILNANGDSIVMLNDGNITMTHSADVNINCANANINATGETHINSPRIKLGEAAAEAVIKGDTFAGIFDAHTHVGNLGAPTSPPTSVTAPSLSAKNTTD
jgi:hypothetical protein|tara:strand:+ start:1124 stop:1984 length:861 start_codon:yes stop_codon:yes gene_type:complete